MESTLEPDDIIEKYKIISQINDKGCSETFLAINTLTNTKVVISKLKKEKNNIMSEFKDIPQGINILSPIEVIQNYSDFYIVNQHPFDGDLEDYVKLNGGKLSESIVRDIIKQILDKLSSIKNTSLAICPQTILIQYDNNTPIVMVGNFGIEFDNKPYVPKDSLNDKIDMWSIGVITYYMLHGSLPFKNFTEIDQDQYTVSDKASPAYIDFLNNCLKKDPKEREAFSMVAKDHLFIKNSALIPCESGNINLIIETLIYLECGHNPPIETAANIQWKIKLGLLPKEKSEILLPKFILLSFTCFISATSIFFNISFIFIF